ncbi:MAG: hypothetical protein M3347_18155 [Armatimonadota bacterium]|nr:hypothetical protein [Armatimonadota bacterium]
MGSSFVNIAGKGFWIRDGILELWLRLLALHIEEPTDAEAPACKIRDRWLLASRGYFNGCVPVHLDDAVSTAEGRALVVAAIESLMHAVKKAPAKLDRHTLNLLGFERGVFTHDPDSEQLIEIGEAFLALIAGEIHSDATSREFMPGSQPAT